MDFDERELSLSLSLKHIHTHTHTHTHTVSVFGHSLSMDGGTLLLHFSVLHFKHLLNCRFQKEIFGWKTMKYDKKARKRRREGVGRDFSEFAF